MLTLLSIDQLVGLNSLFRLSCINLVLVFRIALKLNKVVIVQSLVTDGYYLYRQLVNPLLISALSL